MSKLHHSYGNRVISPKPGRDFRSVPRQIKWSGLGLLFIFLLLAVGTGGNKALDLMGTENTRWQQMCGAIDKTVNGYDGDVAIYIKDLTTGRAYERNANRPFLSASLIKIPVMAAVLKAVKEGHISLDSQMKIRKRYRRGGSGRLKWARSGKAMSVSGLMYKMVTESDNTAAAMLINLVGYQYLNQSFDDFGLKMTRIHPAGMSLANYMRPDRENYTTAREMGYMLERIYHKQLVSDGFSDLMLEVMKDAEAKTRLAKYLPRNFKLARKTGLLRKNCHDVGIVFSPDGDYVICVLTGSNRSYRQAKGLIASVGKKAYQFISHAS